MPRSRSDQYELLRERIRDISFYEDDWDGEGSPAPSVPVIKKSLEFLQGLYDTQTPLPEPGEITPETAGTIRFRWYSPTSWTRLYADIGPDSDCVELKLTHAYADADRAATDMKRYLSLMETFDED